MPRTKNDVEKQRYTALFAANDRLQTLRMIYNERRDMKTLRQIQMALEEVRKAAADEALR